MPKSKSALTALFTFIGNNSTLLLLIAGFIAQHYSIKMTIHDEITERLANERIFEYRLQALEKKTACKLPTQINSFCAILPTAIRITSEYPRLRII